MNSFGNAIGVFLRGGAFKSVHIPRISSCILRTTSCCNQSFFSIRCFSFTFHKMTSVEMPFGAWKSPISSEVAGGSQISFMGLERDLAFQSGNKSIYWLEQRPSEGGRSVICSWNPVDRKIVEWTPQDFNVKTKVHEYGGGAYCIHNGKAYFVNKGDQRIYVQDTPDASVRGITSEDPHRRFADLFFAETFGCLFAVCEDFGVRKSEEDFSKVDPSAEKKVVPDNYIVAIDVQNGTLNCVVRGADFYACPRVSKTGYLVWMEWNMPYMPWDKTDIKLAKLDKLTDRVTGSSVLDEAGKAAGDQEIALTFPEFPSGGGMTYVSDESGWWNLYFRKKGKPAVNLDPVNQDLGHPFWIFGMHSYSPAPTQKENGEVDVFLTYGKEVVRITGTEHFSSKRKAVLDTGFKYHYYYLQSVDGGVYAIGYDAKTPMTLLHLDLATNQVTHIKAATNVSFPGYLSEAQEIEFPTGSDEKAYGYFYPPKNNDYHAPAGTKPPLLVRMHGGPTSQSYPVFKLGYQFYTSRGFAVLDVNYRGSSGYGRDFRKKLNKNWGVMDVEDAVNGAKYLVEKGLVDEGKLCISGGSAGGLSVLNALLFHDTFKAGASHYGVTDLEALVADTHKFEMRYLDIIIGPYPEAKSVYEERSPIVNKDRLKCPVIFFQGTEDKIVPPSQAERMYEVVKQKGLPCAYVLFEGEGHGFTKQENIQTALDAEYAFFVKVFGIEAPHVQCCVAIENL